MERLFKTLQDRLVVMLRLQGIMDIGSANAYIDEFFLDYFNNRFAVEPECTQSAWRKLPRKLDLDRILSFRYEATIGNDNAIRFASMVIDIEPGPLKRSYAGVRAELRQMLSRQLESLSRRQTHRDSSGNTDRRADPHAKPAQGG